MLVLVAVASVVRAVDIKASSSSATLIALDADGDQHVPVPVDEEDLSWLRPHQLRSLLSLNDLPKSGLNNTNDCNNKMCYYLESALSCKALGFGISKICARYFLGYLYGCPAFPTPSELFDAPSTCLPEVLALLPASAKTSLQAAAKSGDKSGLDLTSISSGNHTKAYLAYNFSQNCRRTCFQRYITQANTFYSSCSDQLNVFANKTNQNSLYPLVWTLAGYQEFKNQICVENENGQNCYDSLASINPVVHPQKPGAPNILSFECNYLNDPGYNLLVLQGVCKTLGANGCCAANQIAMIAQAQTNSSATTTYNHAMNSYAVRMIPPCLLHYLSSSSCPAINMTNFCSKGSNGNLTVFGGVVRLNNRAGSTQPFPSMYNEAQVLYLQGVLSFGLPEGSGGFSNPKSKTSVLQVEIVDFAYFNDTVPNQNAGINQLTPTDGTNYFPPGGDYAAAKSGLFRFQFVVQGLNQQESDALYSAITTVGICTKSKLGNYDILAYLYGAGAECTLDAAASGATVLLAEPLSLPPKNDASRGVRRGTSFGALLLATLIIALLSGMMF